MELYLMQHGPALPREEDPDEGLSPEGSATIHTSAKALKKMRISFDAILASPKKRSKQTAALVAEVTGFPPGDILETEKVRAMTPPEETMSFLSGYGHDTRILIAGHLPSLAGLAACLLTEGPPVTIAFERGACCRIDVDTLPTHSGTLKWYVTAEQLELIAP